MMKTSNLVLLVFIFGSIIILFTHLIRWEEANATYLDNWIDYEVVFIDEDEVLLITSDLSDSIHIKINNPYALIEGQVVQINHPIKQLP